MVCTETAYRHTCVPNKAACDRRSSAVLTTVATRDIKNPLPGLSA